MINLSKGAVRTEPVLVDLTDLVPGLKISVRPCTSLILIIAQRRMADALEAARNASMSLASYGFDRMDASGARLDPADPNQMLGIGEIIATVEVGMVAIAGWEGVSIQKGKKKVPAPINRETLTALFLDNRVRSRMRREFDAASRVLVSEGNASGVLRSGSSGRDRTASPPKSAGRAETSHRPARAAKKVRRAKPARKPR